MRQEDTLRILKLAAGDSYEVSMSDTPDLVEVVHRKCGHSFKCTIRDIAFHGFRCSRCNEVLKKEMMHTAEEAHSIELYNKCKQMLPSGFIIYGQTLNDSSVIRVSWPGGEDFTISISDLLARKNLPDCLLHREEGITPSIQLRILDLFIRDELEILDDFDSLEDVIRIKNNSTGVVIRYTVNEVLKEILDRYDKNYKPSVKLYLE